MRAKGEPILYVDDPEGMDRDSRRATLDALGELNRLEHERTASPDTLSRLSVMGLVEALGRYVVH